MGRLDLALGLIGSPRKNGHTALVVRYALELLKSTGYQTKEVSFSDIRITPCGTHCNYNCSHRPVQCPVDDDVPKIYNLLRKADLIVVGCPVYGGLLPSVMYAFKERAQAFVDNWPLTGKDVVLLLNCRSSCERPMHDLERFFGAKSRIISKVIIPISSKEKVSQLTHDECDKVKKALFPYLKPTYENI